MNFIEWFWTVWGIVAPPAFLIAGAWYGSRITEERAVERYRERIKKQEAMGNRAKRAREVLEGRAPRVRRATITGAQSRHRFEGKPEDKSL